MEIKGFPLYAEDLLKELDQQFPDRCPRLSDSDREVWFKAGQRSVVEHLIARKKQAEEQSEEGVSYV